MLRSESEGVSFTASSDERGAYTLNGVPPGRAVITAFTDTLQFQKKVQVPADQDLTIDLVFPAGARLSGRCHPGRQTGREQTCMDESGRQQVQRGWIAPGHRTTVSTRSKACRWATIA